MGATLRGLAVVVTGVLVTVGLTTSPAVGATSSPRLTVVDPPDSRGVYEAFDATFHAVVPDGGDATIAATLTPVEGVPTHVTAAVPAGCQGGCDVVARVPVATDVDGWAGGWMTLTADLSTASGTARATREVMYSEGIWYPDMKLGFQGVLVRLLNGVVDQDGHDIVVDVPTGDAIRPDAVRVRVRPVGGGPVLLDAAPELVPAPGSTLRARVPVGPGWAPGTGSFEVRTTYLRGEQWLRGGVYAHLRVTDETFVKWALPSGSYAPGTTVTVRWEAAADTPARASGLRVLTRRDGGPEVRGTPLGTTQTGFVGDGDDGYWRASGWAQLELPAETGTTTTFDVRLVDHNGLPFGSPRRMVLRTDQVSFGQPSATLVVGRPATVRPTATSPSGTVVRECRGGLRQGGVTTVVRWCTPGSRTVSGSLTVTPTHAGPTAWDHDVWDSSGRFGGTWEVPATVHAARSARVSAPTSVVHGTATRIGIRVTDLTRAGATPVPAQGVTVTLQRQRTDSTTWSTYGRYTTSSTGVVQVPWTASADTSWRLQVAAPYGTVTSPVVLARTTARVSWVSAPTSVRTGSTLALRAKVAPGGRTAVLQARRSGGSWTQVASKAVATDGAVDFSLRAPARGTWEYRVVRPSGGAVSQGVSSVRTVKVT